MKVISLQLCTLFLFASLSLNASDSWVKFSSDTPSQPEVNIIEQNSSRIVLEINIPGMFVYNVEQEGKTFQRLELNPWQTTQDIGKPELPLINQTIGIPSDRLCRVRILESSSVILENYLVYPFQTPTTDVSGGHEKEFVMDEAFYSGKTSSPEDNAYMTEPGIWRDVRISGMHVIPFRYMPRDKQLEALYYVKVEIEFYGHDTETIPHRVNKEISPYFYELYHSKIANFESMGYQLNKTRSDEIKYLVITNDNPLSTIQPLIDWKNEQGFRVEVKTLEEGFNQPQDFKDYITSLYYSDGLEYVLMVGDAYPNGGSGGGPDIVPMYWWEPSGEDGSYSDTWYVCLDGPDDHYADLAIGRFVYDDLDDLEIQIDKTIDHYKTPDASTNWAENTLLVAHKENYPSKYTQCKNEIETYSYALQTPIFEECYGGAGATNNDIIDYVNDNSCGIFNYRGHGSATEFWEWCNSGSFTAAHIAQFTNSDQLFVLFDVCCDNMDIVAYNGDCLCESFMKSPVASVAINGAIIPSYTVPNHDYDKEMYKAVFDEGIYNIGYVTNFANVTVLNVHGSIGRSNVRTYLWLGDASVEPWTLQPQELTVDHNPTIFLGMDMFPVHVESNGDPVENAMVCIVNEDLSLYSVSYTDASGEATMDFGGPLVTPGTATLTVTYHNHLPYQTSLDIIPMEGPYLILNDVDIDDASGNNNGYADFGEHITLNVTVENIGNDSAQDVTGRISSNDTLITITDSVHEWGVIPGQSLAPQDSAFALDVSTQAPDQHIALIEMEFENNVSREVWYETYDLLLNAPILHVMEMVIDDNQWGNGNGRMDPGETVTLKIKNKNQGHCPAVNTVGHLSTLSQYIDIQNETDSIGSLGLLGYKYAEFEVAVDEDAPDGCVFAEFDYVLESGQFSDEKSFIRKIGLLYEDFETGDFSKWAWEQGGDAPWTVTSEFPYAGVYSGKSGVVDDNETTELELTLEIMTADTIYFVKKVSSQSDDKLKFYINGTLKDDWAGVGAGWTDEKFPVGTGMKTFKWVYQKSGSGMSGADHAWLDDIIFPPIMTLTCYAGPDDHICSGEDYQCQGEATDWVSVEWLTSGTGSFDDPEILDPVYSPSSGDIANGSVVLTIIATDSEGDTMDDEMRLVIMSEPETPVVPEGPDHVDLFATQTSEYTTESVENASHYEWHLDPVSAGSISGDQLSGTVEWDDSYLGNAYVSVKAFNECGESDFSEEYEVTVDNTVSVDENIQEFTLQVYPNPNAGDFILDIKSPAKEQIIIKIFNISGHPVYAEKDIPVDGRYTHAVSLEEFPEGIYLLKVTGKNANITQKIVIRK